MAHHGETSTSAPRLMSAIGLIGAIVLGIVGLGALASLKPEPEQLTPPAKKYNVDVFVVENSCLRVTVSGFGTAKPDREVTLSAQVAGQVLAHELEIGQSIKADEPLLEIDPRTYQQKFDQVKSQLEESESELDRLKQEQVNANRLLAQAKSDYETATEQYLRRKSLLTKNIATQDELSRALLEYRQYEEAKIRQENEVALFPLKIDLIKKRQTTTKTMLEMARLDLEHTKVAPPFAGKINEVHVETGQYVRVGDPLLSLTNTEFVEVAVPIKLEDYRKLAPLLESGRSPKVALARDVSEPPEWNGRLMRSAPKADAQSRTIEVFVEVDNTKHSAPLLPGTFVHARIAGPVLEDVFAIPRDAVINNHVLIAKPDAKAPVTQMRISTANTLEDLVILDEGLQAGDRLILTNLDVLYKVPDENAVRQKRSLAISAEHDLAEVLKNQTFSLVETLNCPE